MARQILGYYIVGTNILQVDDKDGNDNENTILLSSRVNSAWNYFVPENINMWTLFFYAPSIHVRRLRNNNNKMTCKYNDMII